MTLLGVPALVQHDAPTAPDALFTPVQGITAGGGTVTDGTNAQYPDDRPTTGSTSADTTSKRSISGSNETDQSSEVRLNGTASGAVHHRPSPLAGRDTPVQMGDPAGCRGTLIPTSSQPGLIRGEGRRQPCSSTAQPCSSWLLPPLRAFRGRSSGRLWVVPYVQSVIRVRQRRGGDDALPVQRCPRRQPHSVTGRHVISESFHRTAYLQGTGASAPLVAPPAPAPSIQCGPAYTPRRSAKP
jgi:hypothetical protein